MRNVAPGIQTMFDAGENVGGSIEMMGCVTAFSLNPREVFRTPISDIRYQISGIWHPCVTPEPSLTPASTHRATPVLSDAYRTPPRALEPKRFPRTIRSSR